jgi:hypothetical protein
MKTTFRSLSASVRRAQVPLILTLALVAGAPLAQAQDGKAVLDLLVKEGILTSAQADKVSKDANKTSSEPMAKEAAKAMSESKTTVSGKIFADFTYITAEMASGAKVNPSGFGIDVRRFYFGVTHQFDKIWLVNINTDAGYSSATGATSLFIKTAYVQAKLAPEAIVQLGSANMPWIPFDEDLYGLRYVADTITDRLKFANSADWGLHFLGSHEIVSYNFALVNGGGYKNPTRSKGMDFEGRISVEPIKGLTFALGLYNGKLGKNSYSAAATRTATRYSALASYAVSKFKVGAEYFSESDWGFTGSTQSDKGEGYAFWGSLSLNDTYSLFARYDADKTSKKLNPNMKEQYSNVGVQYHVMKGLDMSLVYKHDNIDNPASASQVTKYDEFGVFSQVAF